MLHERIRAHLAQGQPLSTAIRRAVPETISAANARLRRDEPPDKVLEDLDLIDIPNIQQYLQPTLATEPWSAAGPLQIVMPGTDIEGIPSPSCIAAHLPKDRPPTADDIRRAWQQCTP